MDDAHPRPRLGFHVLLLLLTFLATTAVGSRLDFNFRHNLPAVDIDRDLLVFLEIWRSPADLLNGLPYSLCLLLILFAHEMGHYLACVYHGIDCTLPFFLPAPSLIGTFGAFIRLRSPVHSRRQLFDVGVAGPLAGFVFALPALGVGLAYSKQVPGIESLGEVTFGHPLLFRLVETLLFPGAATSDLALHPIARAAWAGFLATALNLIPIGQLDGGHIVYSLFGERHRFVSLTAIVALITLFALTYYGPWLVLAVVMLFFGRRHFIVYDDRPLGRGRWTLFWIAAAIFILSFTPVPVGYNDTSRRARSMKISATIITYNEERNLPRAMESLRCCDEIVVVDSGSTDRTVELGERYGARVLEANWRGYAGQKNYASDQAEHDWILALDADEALSEDLEAEIWQLKKTETTFDAYTMPRLAQYLGKWILYSGWYPDRKIRLFDRRKATWVGEYVHESVRVNGTVGTLRGNLLHYTCGSLTEHI